MLKEVLVSEDLILSVSVSGGDVSSHHANSNDAVCNTSNVILVPP